MRQTSERSKSPLSLLNMVIAFSSDTSSGGGGSGCVAIFAIIPALVTHVPSHAVTYYLLN